jgi:hypothetical protein
MDIAFLVASDAGGWSAKLIPFCRPLVAIQAVCFLMGTGDLVLGAAVMIEVPGLPVSRVMATVALPAKTEFMLVLLLVAGITIRLGILEFRGLVTLLALGLDVTAQQRKLRLIVVEPDVFTLPASFVVAVLTLLALLSVVLVILFMAGIAI